MRRPQRLIATAIVVALSGVLAGCAGGMSSFDPSDMLDFLDTKKKLPGERKAVFPEGVPGLEQGVPKELYKGSQQERIDQQNAAAAAAPPAEEPKSKCEVQGQAAGHGQPGSSRTCRRTRFRCTRLRKTAAPPRRRRLPSRQKSCAAAPPRRRRIRRPRSRHSSLRHRSSNPLRRSRRHCRAAPLRARAFRF